MNILSATSTLNLTFSGIFAGGFVLLIVTELLGAFLKGKGDTITENWRWVLAHLPGPAAWGWKVLTGGLLVWTLFHFLG